MNYSWSKLSLGFLLIIATIGTLIRAIPVFDPSFAYDHLLHAHSHVAFQGWIYTLLFLVLTNTFLDKGKIQNRRYKLQFYLTVTVIAGILAAFLIQGYGFYSILLSTIFQLFNYWFVYSLLTDLKVEEDKNKSVPVKFVRMGALLGVLSTLGPWLIAVLSAKGMANSEAYKATIYFFMHFQYNGWFFFSILGLLFHQIETLRSSSDLHMTYYRLNVWLVFFAYLFSLTGMSFGHYLLIPVILAFILQLITLIILYKILRGSELFSKITAGKWTRVFLKTALITYTVKCILQFGSVLPAIGFYALSNRFTLMFFLHLMLIGVLSFYLISWLIYSGWLKNTLAAKIGYALLISGFFVSELLLLGLGIGINSSVLLVFVFSAAMPAGIFLIFLSSLFQGYSETDSG